MNMIHHLQWWGDVLEQRISRQHGAVPLLDLRLVVHPAKPNHFRKQKNPDRQVRGSSFGRSSSITSGRRATFQWITSPRGRHAGGTCRRCSSPLLVHRCRKIWWQREQRILGCRGRAGLGEWSCKSTHQTKSSQKNQSFMHGKLSPGKGGILHHFCQIMWINRTERFAHGRSCNRMNTRSKEKI